MLTSFILPLVVFSIILGAVWLFARGQRGLRPVPIRIPADRPADRIAANSGV